MKRILMAAFCVFAIAACEKERFDIQEPNPVLNVKLNGESVLETLQIIEYQTSVEYEIEYSGTSRITATPPEGWTAEVKMSSNTVTVTAPEYDHQGAATEGQIEFRAYDGQGGHKQFFMNVAVSEGPMSFKIISPDISVVQQFTMSSRITYQCEVSSSVENFNISVPQGWSTQQRERGQFTIISPSFDSESDVHSGEVEVVPVSWSGKIDESLAVKFEVNAVEELTFQFELGGQSFAYGQTIDMICSAGAIASVDMTKSTVPQGWSVNYDRMQEGIISVTAPSEGVEHARFGEMSLTGIAVTGDEIPSNTVNLRILGINSTEDMLAFKDAYLNAGDTSPYLVDGTLVLNDDIVLGEETMDATKAYFIKNMDIPIDGKGYTMTVNYSSSLPKCSIFQNLSANVSNLDIAGEFRLSNQSGTSHHGSIAAIITAQGVIIENVNVSADIVYENSSVQTTYVGGFAGTLDGSGNATVTFRNCTMSGDIIVGEAVKAIGGFLAEAGTGRNCSAEFIDCEFSGNLQYTQTKTYGTNGARIGGIIGDASRRVILSGCSNKGSITANLNGMPLASNTTGSGIGGIIGRDTAPVEGYLIETSLENVINEAPIVINGHAGTEMYGQIIGMDVANANITKYENVQESGSLTINR